MTAKWTAADIPDLSGKVAIVTGANSGIGYEMALAMARKGAKVTLACRNEDKGLAAVQQIDGAGAGSSAEFMRLDLADLVSVRRFAGEFAGKHKRLDILINNAGIMAAPFRKTAEGFESQFATNHLGHFALTGLLLDLIAGTPGSRVVTVSSVGHRLGVIDFDNLNGEKRYNPQFAYAQSKLANLLFAYELQRQFAKAGIDAISTAAHPGWTATNLQAHWRMVQLLNPFISQEADMGALPALYAATAPDAHSGDYYGPGGWQELKGYPAIVQSSERSHDADLAARLWEVSERLTGVSYLTRKTD